MAVTDSRGSDARATLPPLWERDLQPAELVADNLERGRLRVVLALCLKALACNLKRMVRAIRTAAAVGAPAGSPDRVEVSRH